MRNVARLDNERERSVCTRTRTRTTVYRHVSPPPNRETICFQPDGPPSIFYFSIRPAVQLDSWLGPLTRGLDIFVSAPQRTESENTWSPRFSFSFFFFAFVSFLSSLSIQLTRLIAGEWLSSSGIFPVRVQFSLIYIMSRPYRVIFDCLVGTS